MHPVDRSARILDRGSRQAAIWLTFIDANTELLYRQHEWNAAAKRTRISTLMINTLSAILPAVCHGVGSLSSPAPAVGLISISILILVVPSLIAKLRSTSTATAAQIAPRTVTLLTHLSFTLLHLLFHASYWTCAIDSSLSFTPETIALSYGHCAWFNSTAGLIELVLALVTGPMYLMFASLVPWWTILFQVSVQSVPYATYFAMRAWREGIRNGNPAGQGWLPEASVGAIILMTIVFVFLASAGAYSFESSKRKSFANHLNFRLAIGEALQARAQADRGRYKMIQSKAEDTAFLSAFGYIGHEIRNPLHQLSGVLWFFKDSLRVVNAQSVSQQNGNPAPIDSAPAPAAGIVSDAGREDDRTCLLLPAEAAVELKTALRCSEAMQSILSDMLDLGALRTATMTIRDRPTDVCDIARDVITSHLGAVDVKMRLIRNSVVPRKLMLDPHRFRQILVNAVEHALRVTAARRSDTGGTVSVYLFETEALMPVAASSAHAETDAKHQEGPRVPGPVEVDPVTRIHSRSNSFESGSALSTDRQHQQDTPAFRRHDTRSSTSATGFVLAPVLRLMVVDEGATLAPGEERVLFDEFQAAAARKSHLQSDAAHQPPSATARESPSSLLLPFAVPRVVERTGSLSDLAHALLSPVGSKRLVAASSSRVGARITSDPENGDAFGASASQQGRTPRAGPALVVTHSTTVTSPASDRVSTSSAPLNSDTSSPFGASAPVAGLVGRISRLFSSSRAARASGDVTPGAVATLHASSAAHAEASNAMPSVQLTVDTSAPSTSSPGAGADLRIQAPAAGQRWRGKAVVAVTPAHVSRNESVGSESGSGFGLQRGFGSFINPTPSHIAIAISTPAHDGGSTPPNGMASSAAAVVCPSPLHDGDVVEEFALPTRFAAVSADDSDVVFPPQHLGAGSGLGLAIVKRLATAMGGRASIANRTDGVAGTVLQVDLPLKLPRSTRLAGYGTSATAMSGTTGTSGTQGTHPSTTSDHSGSKSAPTQFSLSLSALSTATDMRSITMGSRLGTLSRDPSHNPAAASMVTESAPFTFARLSSRLTGISSRMMHRGVSVDGAGSSRLTAIPAHSASSGGDLSVSTETPRPPGKLLPTVHSEASLLAAGSLRGVRYPVPEVGRSQALASTDRSSLNSAASGSPISPAASAGVSASSVDGEAEGTAVSVSLPMPRAPEARQQHQQQRDDASGRTVPAGMLAVGSVAHVLQPARKSAGSKLRVLAVDDEAANRRLIARFIEKADVDVDLLTDGDEVLPHLQKCLAAGDAVGASDEPTQRRLGWPYTAILLDIRMPRMHGVQCLQELKRAGLSDAVPVLAVTGNIAEEDVAVYRETGFSGAIGKPFTLSILKAAVRQGLYPYSFASTALDSADAAVNSA